MVLQVLDDKDLDPFENRAVEALRRAEEVLTATEITPELAAHGWSRQFALELAGECAGLRTHIEARSYEPTWGRGGLGRWVQEDVSPLRKDMDPLRESIHEASRALGSLSEHLRRHAQ
jgi:hypothetical protein